MVVSTLEALVMGVREDPRDPAGWAALADYLRECGWDAEADGLEPFIRDWNGVMYRQVPLPPMFGSRPATIDRYGSVVEW